LLLKLRRLRRRRLLLLLPRLRRRRRRRHGLLLLLLQRLPVRQRLLLHLLLHLLAPLRLQQKLLSHLHLLLHVHRLLHLPLYLRPHLLSAPVALAPRKAGTPLILGPSNSLLPTSNHQAVPGTASVSTPRPSPPSARLKLSFLATVRTPQAVKLRPVEKRRHWFQDSPETSEITSHSHYHTPTAKQSKYDWTDPHFLQKRRHIMRPLSKDETR